MCIRDSLDHDRLFREYPEGAGRSGADRRRRLHPDAHQDLHPCRAARHHRRHHLRLHRVVGRLPLPHGLHHLGRPARAARWDRHHPHPRRRLRLGPDHGRVPARRAAAAADLRLPHGLLHRRPDGGRDEGLTMARVSLKQLVKNYEDTPAVRGIDLDILDKEFVVLVGPSGCGKTTTLRMIAGLEDITAGEVVIGEDVVNDVPPKDRNIAMVFQNYALYPHMTVHENMSFGLRLKKVPKGEINRRVDDAARILGLADLLNRKPRELSGGQRQRVAMGRAIVRDPKVFLFDEPLSNLDAKLRVQMRTEIKKIHQKVRTTTVYVTHDQVEACLLYTSPSP